MNKFRFSRRIALALVFASAFAAPSAWATLVTWDLNPSGIDGALGSSSHNYTVSGYSITARGYDNNHGTGIAHELYYKNAGASELGLGLVNTPNNELQVSGGVPLQFIQLDLRSILSQGFINGQIEIGSVQSGELFNLYGSNTLGGLGTKLNLTPYDSSKDDVFVSVPNFGTYQFISVVAAAADVLPVAFRATITPVPEVTPSSVIFGFLGLLVAVSSRRALNTRLRPAPIRQGK